MRSCFFRVDISQAVGFGDGNNDAEFLKTVGMFFNCECSATKLATRKYEPLIPEKASEQVPRWTFRKPDRTHGGYSERRERVSGYSERFQ